MSRRARQWLAVVVAVVAAATTTFPTGPARADSPAETHGPRALALGDSARAAATGASAISLNPAGLSLSRAYVVEGSYGLRPADDMTVASLSVCDSTRRYAACVHYGHLAASPDAGDRELSEWGSTVSMPLSERLLIGTTGRYVNYAPSGGAGGAGETREKAIIVDVGLVARLGSRFDAAVVGHNVVGGDDDQFPRAVGAGLALQALPNLQVTADGLFRLAGAADSTARYGGGAELFVAQTAEQRGFPLRIGYAHDRASGASYLSGGVGYVDARFALDASLRRQVVDGDELTMLVGLRIFMPPR